MEQLQICISKEVEKAFTDCGYQAEYGKVAWSNRPDLCQFQCNGALVAGKVYKQAPLQIAEEIASKLKKSSLYKSIVCVMPGFINITLTDDFIARYLNDMAMAPKWGCSEIGKGKKMILDYGGPNVAKPLHVGHLRTAIIGESLKRVGRFLGYKVLGDAHLGDWGLPIGLIITELKKRSPNLPYFDSSHIGAYPKEPPFLIDELEEMYPTANRYAKEVPSFMEEAKEATYLFQNGHRGYVALWKHILDVSITDLKRNYKQLNVSFDLWNKESDVQGYIPTMVQQLIDQGDAYESEGALVVDVKEESDQKEMPPCILVKSDGGTLYSTTDLATIAMRRIDYNPDEIIYIVDKRQAMHFEQVFRCARKTHLIDDKTKLIFLGFGTVNGKDGKPYKTRDGGVMRLENLIKEVTHKVYEKVSTNKSIKYEEGMAIASKIGIAALKYGDLSNQISKDHIFDLDRFTDFEGNTGPYILYTVVRIGSILSKYREEGQDNLGSKIEVSVPSSKSERDLMLKLTRFNEIIEASFINYAPHRICQYIYEVSNSFNHFYHEHNILKEQDKNKQVAWINLITLTQAILTVSLELLGIEVPEKM